MKCIKRRITAGLWFFGLLFAASILISRHYATSAALGESSLYSVTLSRIAIWTFGIGCGILLFTLRFGYAFWNIDRDRWINGRATTRADALPFNSGLTETPKRRLNRMDWLILFIVFVIGPGSVGLLSNPKPPSAFLLVEKNAVAALDSQLQDKPSLIHEQNKYGQTLLMAATRSGQIEMVDYLLAHGVELNAVDRSGKTAAAYAVGQPELLNLLLQNGASANRINSAGTPPLHLAIQQKCRLSCDILLKHGARVNEPESKGASPLIMAVHRGFNIQDLLLNHGAKPDLVDPAGESALHYAAKADNLKAAQDLILAGADMNLPSAQGWPPLHVAALNDSWTVASFLLKEGVAVDYLNQRQQTPLHCALHKNSPEFVEFLLDHGANVDFVDPRGNTYLHYALLKENYAMASLLISYGAAVGQANNTGITPEELMANLNWHPKSTTNLHRAEVPRGPKNAVAVVE
ncbi:ankyrin repeat domain-containing protein [Pontiellaceae bacterium B12219]|nr:ankyrin repeat domain-containing protein [Pontiellaceae bacterium B12219]